MESLIQRLNEITARLIAEEKVLKRDEVTLLACHGKLDGLEELAFGTVLHRESPRDRTLHSRMPGNNDQENSATTTASPSWLNNDDHRKSNDRPQFPPRASVPEESLICHGETILAQEQQRQQQQLLQRISRAAQELRNRHEELKVRAHTILIKLQ